MLRIGRYSRFSVTQQRLFSTTRSAKMLSSKGKLTDPELSEQLKEEIKQEPNKSGGGEGQWSAWKASKLSKAYKEHGGSYENDPGSKKPKNGGPEPKSETKKQDTN